MAKQNKPSGANPGGDDPKFLIRPSWDDDHKILTWIEASGTPMSWEPETDELRKEAEAFYTKHTLGGRPTYAELAAQPRQEGQWIVRWVMMGIVKYYEKLKPNADGSPWELVPDVNEGTIMSHDETIQIVQQLVKDLDYKDGDGDAYVEPVRLQQAIEDDANRTDDDDNEFDLDDLDDEEDAST